MQTPDQNELFEKALRGQMNADETERWHAALERDPELRTNWETESALMQALRNLPDAPVSSNFTAQVWQLVEREFAPRRGAGRFWSSNFWTAGLGRKLAWGGALLMVAGLALHQYDLSRREELAQCVATVSSAASAPPLDILVDFEAIKRLDQAPLEIPFPKADVELLAALH